MTDGERAWPSASAYVVAVQAPTSLAPAALAGARPRPGPFGLPTAVTGQHGVVFPLEQPAGAVALKCFTTPPDDATRHRYRLLSDHLRRVSSPLVDVRWHERGILVDGRWWPVVVMPWLPGTTLDLAVAARLDEPAALRSLAREVRSTLVSLGAARIAHGDLQHGNLLVEDDGHLHLVDYDGVWVPGAEALSPRELGHRAYQHPQRLASGGWGPWVDVVPGLVIYLSLRAVAADPTLWERGHDGENLILTSRDLAEGDGSDMVHALRTSPDEVVGRLADLLVRCCAAPPGALGRLEVLLRQLDGGAAVAPAVDVRAPGARPHWLAAPPSGPEQAGAPPPAAGPPPEADFVWTPQRRRRRLRRR